MKDELLTANGELIEQTQTEEVEEVEEWVLTALEILEKKSKNK